MKRDDGQANVHEEEGVHAPRSLSAALSDDELQRTLVAALLALDHAGIRAEAGWCVELSPRSQLTVVE